MKSLLNVVIMISLVIARDFAWLLVYCKRNNFKITWCWENKRLLESLFDFWVLHLSNRIINLFISSQTKYFRNLREKDRRELKKWRKNRYKCRPICMRSWQRKKINIERNEEGHEGEKKGKRGKEGGIRKKSNLKSSRHYSEQLTVWSLQLKIVQFFRISEHTKKMFLFLPQGRINCAKT